jgi:hypothetical protein
MPVVLAHLTLAEVGTAAALFLAGVLAGLLVSGRLGRFFRARQG